jgi:hypothetical protein
VSTGGLKVGMESIGLGDAKGVEVSQISEPDFTGVTVPRATPSNVEGKGAELGASGRGG